MEDNLFDNQEKINAAINDFTNLLDHPGWKLFVQVVEKNIEVLKNQLENGTEGEETKADVDRIRDKLKICREMRDTPQTLIKKFQSPDIPEPDDDPYESTLSPEVDNVGQES